VASPMPLVPPVITTRFPSYCPMVAFSLVRPKSRLGSDSRRRAEPRAPSCQFRTVRYDNRSGWSGARSFELHNSKTTRPRGQPRSFDEIEARERRPRTRQLTWVTTFNSAAIGCFPQDTELKG